MTPKKSSKPAKSTTSPSARARDARVRRSLREAALAAAGKKAVEPVLLDLRLLGGFADYFYICTGANPRQMQAIAEAIEEQLLRRHQLRPVHREGGAEGDWLVLDYLDFVVHIFSPRSRGFYDLERLWAKASRLALPAGLGSER